MQTSKSPSNIQDTNSEAFDSLCMGDTAIQIENNKQILLQHAVHQFKQHQADHQKLKQLENHGNVSSYISKRRMKRMLDAMADLSNGIMWMNDNRTENHQPFYLTVWLQIGTMCAKKKFFKKKNFFQKALKSSNSWPKNFDQKKNFFFGGKFFLAHMVPFWSQAARWSQTVKLTPM